VNSISLKITVWSFVALLLSLAVFVFIGNSVIGKFANDSFTQFSQVFFRDAMDAYRTGGSSGLSRFLQKVNGQGGIQFHLTDPEGHDLATSENRSALVQATVGKHRPIFRDRNGITMGVASEDGRYIWLISGKPPSLVWFLPFYILLLATVASLYWLVAARIARPLRSLAGIVERFGKSDLTARASTQSRDEIGDLSRSFNAMADRIETLLMSERQLLQDVSHELRSPLARLKFEAEMVRKAVDRDEIATRLRQEIDRLSELVGTLIDMARAEGEPGTIAMGDLSLNDLLVATVEDCEVETNARGCAIALQATEPISIDGNPELLRRAFENVLRNAIRYAPAGTLIEVKLNREGHLAVISVRDYGPGIPHELTEKIFDPFFRADPSRNENTGGLGLGLAIARRAVRVHGGEITATNASPGALLRIALPLDTVPA
jgi:two-component system sensor histidine kinase CpxA